MAWHASKDGQVALKLAIGGCIMIGNAIFRHLRAQKLRDTPPCPVASMAAGFGEAHGVAWPCRVYKDSYGYDVAYLEQYVEEYVRSGKSGSWVTRGTFISHREHTFFYLLDNSGLAKIYPHKSKSSMRDAKRDWRKLTPAQVQMVLANVRMETPPKADSFFSSSWRVRVRRIYVANPVLVQGNFSPYPTHQVLQSVAIAYLREKFNRFINPFIRAKLPFDFNRDGKVDAEEMRIGMSRSLELAHKEELAHQAQTALNQNAEKEHHHAVCGEFTLHPTHELFFADAHESDLMKRIGSWNGVLFVAGACLIGVALYFAFGVKR